MHLRDMPALPHLQELHLEGCDLHTMGWGSILENGSLLLCSPQLRVLSLKFAETGFAGQGGFADVLSNIGFNERAAANAAALFNNNPVAQRNEVEVGQALQQQQQESSSAQTGVISDGRQQFLADLTQQLSGLRELRLQAPCTGLPAEMRRYRHSMISEFAMEDRALALFRKQQDAAAVSQLPELFSCLAGLTSLQLKLTQGPCGIYSSAHATHNACQPLYAALGCLPNLRQLQLSGLPELPAAGASAASSAAAAASGASCVGFAALLQLQDLDLQDCGSSNSSSSSSTGSSSKSHASTSVPADISSLDLDADEAAYGAHSSNSGVAGSRVQAAGELALPCSLTHLRWVHCCDGQLPLRQLAAGLPQLQQLLLDRHAADQAGTVLLQQLADRGCKVVVEPQG
jgi:hypothetical protein